MKTEVKRAAQMHDTESFDLFDLLHMIKSAYQCALKKHSIELEFQKAGL